MSGFENKKSEMIIKNRKREKKRTGKTKSYEYVV